MITQRYYDNHIIFTNFFRKNDEYMNGQIKIINAYENKTSKHIMTCDWKFVTFQAQKKWCVTNKFLKCQIDEWLINLYNFKWR